ncbi:HNH endonuclease [Oceanobacillus damuensis]|uniref:HNH endonuclease n=1 Tax=Oceanobacillus damuensis TaxID=937928 RepID=UPI000829802A|nr:HNH endonuclease [Oceanobacillus damuensis]
MEKEVVLPDGDIVEGTFPAFESDFQVTISEDLYLQSDSVHFSYANTALYDQIAADPQLAGELGLSPAEVQALENGDTPEGYVWHHTEDPGVLQLVDKEIHAETGHTGGRSLWGGGSVYR